MMTPDEQLLFTMQPFGVEAGKVKEKLSTVHRTALLWMQLGLPASIDGVKDQDQDKGQ